MAGLQSAPFKTQPLPPGNHLQTPHEVTVKCKVYPPSISGWRVASASSQLALLLLFRLVDGGLWLTELLQGCIQISCIPDPDIGALMLSRHCANPGDALKFRQYLGSLDVFASEPRGNCCAAGC